MLFLCFVMGNENFILEHSHHLFDPKWDFSNFQTFWKSKQKIYWKNYFEQILHCFLIGGKMFVYEVWHVQ